MSKLLDTGWNRVIVTLFYIFSFFYLFSFFIFFQFFSPFFIFLPFPQLFLVLAKFFLSTLSGCGQEYQSIYFSGDAAYMENDILY